MAFSIQDATRPPIGSGNYASWVVFVVVIMLSVALATILTKGVLKVV